MQVEYDKNRFFRLVSRFIACCQRCDRQVLWTECRRTVACWWHSSHRGRRTTKRHASVNLILKQYSVTQPEVVPKLYSCDVSLANGELHQACGHVMLSTWPKDLMNQHNEPIRPKDQFINERFQVSVNLVYDRKPPRYAEENRTEFNFTHW